MKCSVLLMSLFVVGLFGCSGEEPVPANPPVETVDEETMESGSAVSAETPFERMKREVEAGEAVVLDVRSQAEWDAGHLKAAKFVPITELADGVDAVDLDGVPKDQPVYTHCKAGVRAKKAAEILREAGYDAIPLSEGFDELKDAGFEVE